MTSPCQFRDKLVSQEKHTCHFQLSFNQSQPSSMYIVFSFLVLMFADIFTIIDISIY